MSTQHLNRLFNPKGVAVIGASERTGSVGCAIMKNLMNSKGKHTVFPVNPRHKKIFDQPCAAHIQDIEEGVDMAVIATPIRMVPDLIADCGKKGIAGAVVVSSGGRETGAEGQTIEEQILAAARKYDLRIIGPNCLGIINTAFSMNASFAHLAPLPGNMAFLSQSGAVCTSVLDMALQENVGFSHFVSLGSMADVDFADMIDYLGSQRSVQSIVMYVENITNIRNFMSAARAVSRIKPIIVLKSGRSRAGARAAASHTGAMAGEDALYDTAFQRAGILRVTDFEELFDCAEYLAKQPRPKGCGLTIITNAGGPGVMAADALGYFGLEPVRLSARTLEGLDALLPGNWSRGNPVDILGDTPATAYVETMKICAADPDTDALLLICSPAGTVDTRALAEILVPHLKTLTCPVFTAWIGGDNVAKARNVFNQAGIVTYDSAERAVRAFKNLYEYGKNIDRLTQIPIRMDTRLIIHRETARSIIHIALAEKNTCLLENTAKALLDAYGIPVNDTKIADTEEAALKMAKETGFPVVLKICSKDIPHKSDCNGVALDLRNAQDVTAAYRQIMADAEQHFPAAHITGVTVQAMQPLADVELIIGARKDPQFGPVIIFGMGGVLTEVFKDISMGLPPLNRMLAGHLIGKTKIAAVLKGFRNIRPIDMGLLEELLIRTGRLMTDFPEIETLDINPLMVKNGILTAVDARVFITPATVPSPMHLIISSYPWQYESRGETVDGQFFFIRPIRPSDADLLIEHFHSLSSQSRYMRFFSPLKELSRDMLIKLTQIDYDREIALVALMGKKDSQTMVGVCRIIVFPDQTQAEFAIAISDDWQGKGIGSSLLTQCLKSARQMGIRHVMGVVLAENTQMLKLGRKLGFTIKRMAEGGEYELIIETQDLNID
ncbi:MAG: bifunctional acetate--CoA ligase family protein/GNAT family N-acetyltransferase [Desulfotignum sp.]|nr:bifunctional acetate--CoA ligase family protein/GNAT family N-acetyltransferase [Desulfotignum sp.]